MKFIFTKKLHETDKHLLESRFRLLGVVQKLFFCVATIFSLRSERWTNENNWKHFSRSRKSQKQSCEWRRKIRTYFVILNTATTNRAQIRLKCLISDKLKRLILRFVNVRFRHWSPFVICCVPRRCWLIQIITNFCFGFDNTFQILFFIDFFSYAITSKANALKGASDQLTPVEIIFEAFIRSISVNLMLIELCQNLT